MPQGTWRWPETAEQQVYCAWPRLHASLMATRRPSGGLSTPAGTTYHGISPDQAVRLLEDQLVTCRVARLANKNMGCLV